MNLQDIFNDPRFLITAASALLAFATVLTIGMPLMERDTLAKRMKAVAEQREALRARRQAELNARRTGLRAEAAGVAKFMKTVVERFNLSRLAESDDSRGKLVRAGLRGQAPLPVFIFFRFVMPVILFVCGLIYFFVLAHYPWSGLFKLAAALVTALIGYYLPDLFISNLISKRQESIMLAFPDALDLLLICVESGMSIELAFAKVSTEIGQTSPILAEEFALTTAELSYLPERKQAFENFAKRCGTESVQAVTTALIQAERYGTPLGQALRICAQENREKRMANAEKKAAALPAKLTVPMILFFLPSLFAIILGPAIMQIAGML